LYGVSGRIEAVFNSDIKGISKSRELPSLAIESVSDAT
jgi:hypothetical protein